LPPAHDQWSVGAIHRRAVMRRKREVFRSDCDLAGTCVPSARPARPCCLSVSDLRISAGGQVSQPAVVRFALLGIAYAFAATCPLGRSRSSTRLRCSPSLRSSPLAVTTCGPPRFAAPGALLLRSASGHAGSAALQQLWVAGEDPSASGVALSWTSLQLRLTLRCSGRQPGVRPVAAAELKYR